MKFVRVQLQLVALELSAVEFVLVRLQRVALELSVVKFGRG